MRKITEVRAKELVGIGFCQPKFYKRSVWLASKRIMEELAIPNGLAHHHDFGRGKGKYSTNLTTDEVKDAVVVILKGKDLIKAE